MGFGEGKVVEGVLGVEPGGGGGGVSVFWLWEQDRQAVWEYDYHLSATMPLAVNSRM